MPRDWLRAAGGGAEGGAAVLYLHIGTVKTGSTSVQAWLKQHEAVLAERGVLFPAIGRDPARHKHHLLRLELRLDAHGGEGWAEIRSLRARCPDRQVLLSDEAFSLLEQRDVAHLHEVAGGGPITVITYFRDYASLLPSLYAEYTKNGRNLLDFDSYFEQVMARPSQFDVIARWAAAVGWENIRVRLFHRDRLVRGNVVDDLLTVLGLDRRQFGAAPPEDRRTSPGWQSLEITRAVLGRIARLPDGLVDGKLPLFIRSACMEACAAIGPPGPPVGYLSAGQLRRCEAATRHDLDALNERVTGERLALPLTPSPDAPARQFLPSIEHVPTDSVAEAMANLTLLLAAQVPDGRVDRKRAERKARLKAEGKSALS